MTSNLTVDNIFTALRQRGVTLTVEPGRLRVHGGTVPGPLAKAIREHMDDVLATLQQQEETTLRQQEEAKADLAEAWTVNRLLDMYNKLLPTRKEASS